MLRFRILAIALVVTAAVLVVRWIMHGPVGMTIGLEWGDMQVVVTGASLIIGLMIAGVLRDYVEASQLPGSVAAALASLASITENAGAAADFDSRPHRQAIVELSDAVFDWLHQRITDRQIGAKVLDTRRMLVHFEKSGASSTYISRALAELATVDAGVRRMMVLRNTSYLASGYALMDVLTAIVVVLLIIVRFEQIGVAQWLITGALTLIFVYLVTLVRDLDNPFSYDGNGGGRGGAEVDLSPLIALREELHGELRRGA